MPLYEYKCDKCSKIFEVYVRRLNEFPADWILQHLENKCYGLGYRIVSIFNFAVK